MSAYSVSVCIPTFNGARWILDAIDSARSQSFSPSEILVVDDHSTDNTVELVRSIKDERIRLVTNDHNLGLVNNWNRCVSLSRGNFIKFLLQDDILYTQCIEKMIELFRADEALGLVFAPRDIILEVEDATTKVWLRHSTTLHTRFHALKTLNRGRELFAQYLRKEFYENWIGEPSSVMIKRECFERLGPFNAQVYQLCDLEMWLRIMFFYDVGFVAEKLSAFRHHAHSASRSNLKTGRAWLDQVRLLEGLLSHDEIRLAHPEIKRMRRRELMRVMVRRMIPLGLRRRVPRPARG